jgi:hypothetical protein
MRDASRFSVRSLAQRGLSVLGKTAVVATLGPQLGTTTLVAAGWIKGRVRAATDAVRDVAGRAIDAVTKPVAIATEGGAR